MSFRVLASNENPFKSDAECDALRKEVADYQKCVRGNYARIKALTAIQLVDGSKVDPHSCAPVSRELLHLTGQYLIALLMKGMRLNGKTDNWSIGGMGSRWIDLDAEEFGVDYVRCAFYSKRNYDGEWKEDKPFLFQITVEKARD